MSNASNRRRWVKAARYSLYGAVALLVAVVSAAFILPEVLDSPAVRAEIQRKLSEVVQGDVAWDDLNIRILPSPRGVLRKAWVELPGIASVRAERIDARLLFWPLLRGRAEITTVSVVRPEIRIDIAPAQTAGKSGEEGADKDPVAAYRSAIGPIVDLVRQFAPDTTLTIEDASVDVRASGLPPIELSELSLRAQTGSKSIEIDLSSASNYWSRLRLAVRLDYSDLSGKANLEAEEIRPQAWLDRYLTMSPMGISVAAVRLRAEARTDAKSSLECEIDARTGSVEIAHAGERLAIRDVGVKGKVRVNAQETIIDLTDVRLGGSRLTSGELRYSWKDGALSGHSAYDLDLAQGMDYARRLAPEEAGAVLAWFQPVTGRAQGRVKLDLGQPNWSVGVDIRRSDASVQVKDLPGPVRLAGGAVEIDRRAVTIDRVALSMPAGQLLLSQLRYSLQDGTTAGSAGFDLDLAASLELVRRLLPEENRAALADIQSVTGRAQGNAKFAVSGDHWSAGVDVLKSDSTMRVRQLPGPVSITGGSVQIDPKKVSVDRVAVSMLDAQAVVSATVSDYRAGRLQATAAMPEGAVGERVLAWIWQLAKAPPHLELKSPIRVAATRVTWGPQQALDVQATVRFGPGPGLAVELGWTPKSLDIRRIAIKDDRSDATIAVRSEGRWLEGKFTGTLHSTSIAAMLRNAQVPAGSAAGDLRFAYDRDNPRRTTAEGHLKGEALDLAWLLRRPVKIDRIDIAADEAALRIREAAVDWAGQRAMISGVVRRSASGPVIDAQLDSPGVIVDALLPREDKIGGEKPPEAEGRSKQAPDDKGEPSRLWPLPVTGRIAVRSDFVQSGRLKVAPVAATLVLEERRARLDLTQAQLCGVSLPLTVEATPRGYAASARIAAQKQQLEQTAHCLTDRGMLITGDFDLQADIKTEGKAAELARNLKGRVRADVRDGKVMKFALLGNILSMGNIAALLEEGGPRLDEAGFPYRTITVSGHFAEGRFIVEESAFQSDAVGLAATGWVSVLDYRSQLSVLVAPFGRIDRLVRKVPILGYIIGGALTSVPVGVSGDIRDPLVVPLGPGAITSELVGIFERTLKLPAKLVAPPDGGATSQ